MRRFIEIFSICLALVFVNGLFGQSNIPPAMEECVDEPVKYIGDRQPDPAFYDGRVPHIVGVHHYQAMRANRSHSPVDGQKGWTYNHQPFLAYWKGKFYLQYLSDEIQEHTPPGRTLIMTSENGREWSDLKVVFPVYKLPEINFAEINISAGTKSVMHQRMGFYVAPNGKLLTSGFYSYCATPRNSPNAGNGLGRVVREIKEDGGFGPIYFIRYNRHAGFDESNTNYPYYKSSGDKGFVAACEALLADKLITLQWWEEDRAKDDFYVIDPGDVKNAAYFSAKITTSAGAGKAFNYFRRPDDVVVGLWKNQWSALSADNGLSWTKISQNKSLWTCGAKTWGQRTDDGRYAIVHNQSATRRNRFPMVILTSDDGHTFDNMLCLRGEVPLKRYQGLHKNTGPQYYRGIIEGNGNPPGNDMWIVYSVNKEDMWIARVQIPIREEVSADVDQDFQNIETISDLNKWNLVLPKWAPITVSKDSKSKNKYLEFRDEEPYDYCLAERVFPKSKKVGIQFRFNANEVPQGNALIVEVQDQTGSRPMRLRIDRYWLGIDRKKIYRDPLHIESGKWYKVNLVMDCEDQTYDVILNDDKRINQIPFAEKVANLERIEFRTGPYRGYVPPAIVHDGMPKPAGLENEDAPGSETQVSLSSYFIDDLKIVKRD
jgi:hypothetical protein